MSDSVLVPVLTASVPLAVAIVGWVASSRANRDKIDADAYTRAQSAYELVLTSLENRVVSLNNDLGAEREQVTRLRGQVARLRREIRRLRDRMSAAGLSAADDGDDLEEEW